MSEQNTAQPATPATRSAWSLLGKGALLLGLCAATTLGIAWTIPDGNDYAEATVLKHRRLAAAEGKRIVLVGGSNLAFGVDSSVLERETGCQAVNMGMNGYLGVRYMLAEAEPHLRPGDVVVISLEYDSFFKSPDGTAVDQLMIVKANPEALQYLDWEQRAALVPAVPYIAQQKILRVLREAADTAWMKLLGLPMGTADAADIHDIETLAGFTERGDLISHLDVIWEWEREDGVDATNTPADPEVVPLLKSFSDRMHGRGIHVVVSPTSVMHQYYTRHRASLEAVFASLSSAGLQVPSAPSAYVFDDELFFDTVYHLNKEGRLQRSQRLASDIVRQLDADAFCNSSTLISKHEAPHE